MFFQLAEPRNQALTSALPNLGAVAAISTDIRTNRSLRSIYLVSVIARFVTF